MTRRSSLPTGPRPSSLLSNQIRSPLTSVSPVPWTRITTRSSPTASSTEPILRLPRPPSLPISLPWIFRSSAPYSLWASRTGGLTTGSPLCMDQFTPSGLHNKPSHHLVLSLDPPLPLLCCGRHDDIQIQHNVAAQKVGGYTRYTVDQSAKMRLDKELMLGYVQARPLSPPSSPHDPPPPHADRQVARQARLPAAHSPGGVWLHSPDTPPHQLLPGHPHSPSLCREPGIEL
jgi:hypothetical protein